MKRFRLAYLLGILGTLAIAAVLAYALTKRPLSVEVASLASDVPVRVFGLGTVEARVLSKVGFEAGATLIELKADHGDRVAKGTVLARLASAEQEARLAKAN